MLHKLTGELVACLQGKPNKLQLLLADAIVRWPGLTRIRIYDKQPDGSKRTYLITIKEETKHGSSSIHDGGSSQHADIPKPRNVRNRKGKAGKRD
jgi:hypothetical protein